jgi:hypothetical protein
MESDTSTGAFGWSSRERRVLTGEVQGYLAHKKRQLFLARTNIVP